MLDGKVRIFAFASTLGVPLQYTRVDERGAARRAVERAGLSSRNPCRLGAIPIHRLAGDELPRSVLPYPFTVATRAQARTTTLQRLQCECIQIAATSPGHNRPNSIDGQVRGLAA